MNGWTKGEVIALFGVIVTGLGVAVPVMNPELRCFLVKDCSAIKGNPPPPVTNNDPTPLSSPEPEPVQSSSALSEQKPETEETEKLPPRSYKARVNWSFGLSLRTKPSIQGSERIGHLDYYEKVIVLEKSRDGEWGKVRVAGTNQEGWIKAGNVEKID